MSWSAFIHSRGGYRAVVCCRRVQVATLAQQNGSSKYHHCCHHRNQETLQNSEKSSEEINLESGRREMVSVRLGHLTNLALGWMCLMRYLARHLLMQLKRAPSRPPTTPMRTKKAKSTAVHKWQFLSPSGHWGLTFKKLFCSQNNINSQSELFQIKVKTFVLVLKVLFSWMDLKCFIFLDKKKHLQPRNIYLSSIHLKILPK